MTELLSPTDWTWTRPLEGLAASFWVATAPDGDQWVLKMRGSFYAYREIVFERLVRRLGWAGQASRLVLLDASARSFLASSSSQRIDAVQLASPLLKEHGPISGCPACPLPAINAIFEDDRSDPLDLLPEHAARVSHLLDWPRSYVLAALLGSNEPFGRLITSNHELVLIDGEQCLATGPTDPRITPWWERPDGTRSVAGRRLTRSVCIALGALSDDDLQSTLQIPQAVAQAQLWDIAPLLYRCRDAARIFAEQLA